MIKTKYMFSEAKAKAKDLAPKAKAKAKDVLSCPRGASRPRPWPRGLHLCLLYIVVTWIGMSSVGIQNHLVICGDIQAIF